MSLRLLFEMFASVLPVSQNNSEIMKTPEKEGVDYMTYIIPNADIQNAVKFHIGMLTVSFLLGLAYGGYVGYKCWIEKETFLGYIRNLVIALVCRTFFSILFDGVVILGETSDGGGKTLLALEQFFLNLVLGFWLSLTVYAHARVQRNFKSEPSLRLYEYGIPVVALYFVFVWIFTLQSLTLPMLWLSKFTPYMHWIVNSINLLFLLIQLGLVADMGKMMLAMKSTFDNDTFALIWKAAAMMGALVLIIWLQFGLSLGLGTGNWSYLHFFYFMDGAECALICVCLYFFYMWVGTLLNNISRSTSSEDVLIEAAESKDQEILPDGRGIITVDTIFNTQERRRWKTSEREEFKDVLYSNVVDPHRLEKTLELYKRLNVIPSQVTLVEGEEFYDCQLPAEQETANRKVSQNSVTKQEIFHKNEKVFQTTQKRNAFYASKYLILEPKEDNLPKYLETRPSVSSMSEKDSQKEEQMRKTYVPDILDAKELVTSWLSDNSENMLQSNKPSMTCKGDIKELTSENSDREAPKFDLHATVSRQSHQDTRTENISAGKDKGNVDRKNNTIAGVNQAEITNKFELTEESTKDEKNTNLPHIGKQISSEPIVSIPREKQRPTVPEGIDKKEDFSPNEIVVNQSLDVSNQASNQPKGMTENDAVAPAPTKNTAVATDEPKDSPNEFLTYDELLQYRSQREKSDEPSVNKHSLSESIFSKLDSIISASGSLLNSLAGFEAQAEETFKINDRLPAGDSNFKPQQPHEEKTIKEPETQKPKIKGDFRIDENEPKKDLKAEFKLPEAEKAEGRDGEPKAPSHLALPSEKAARVMEKGEGNIIRRESNNLRDENKTKDDVPENMRDIFSNTIFEEQCKINLDGFKIKPIQKQQEQVSDNLEESKEGSVETSSDSEFSIEKYRFPSKEWNKPIQKHQPTTLDTRETQIQSSETSDSELNTERERASSSESFSIAKYYEEVMAATAKFGNQQSPLKFNQKSKNA